MEPSFLLSGGNIVTLTAAGDSTDVSLVDYLRLSYQCFSTPDSDTVDLVGAPLQAATVAGFTTPNVRVMDVSQPGAVVELPGQVTSVANRYAVAVNRVPCTRAWARRRRSREHVFAFPGSRRRAPRGSRSTRRRSGTPRATPRTW